jgi:hypothetical protein
MRLLGDAHRVSLSAGFIVRPLRTLAGRISSSMIVMFDVSLMSRCGLGA